MSTHEIERPIPREAHWAADLRPGEEHHCAAVSVAYVMACAVANAGVDPADEAAVIVALMDVGSPRPMWSAHKIMDNIEQVKLLAWAMRFKVSPERMGLFSGA